MGWNDHMDWEMESDFDELLYHDMFEEMTKEQIEVLRDAVINVMWLRASPAEKVLVALKFTPLRQEVAELYEKDHFHYIMTKDD